MVILTDLTVVVKEMGKRKRRAMNNVVVVVMVAICVKMVM
ncbi:hypothetical protein A2U01_0108599, partial [Trifolium medium]|nr:hypothetical protein [Trifolium medium]